MIYEYETMLSEVKKHLQYKNIRKVYRLLNLEMPNSLEEHLIATGSILWEHFTATAVNQYDVRGVMSSQLGAFDTGLAVLPPVNSLYGESQLVNNKVERDGTGR